MACAQRGAMTGAKHGAFAGAQHGAGSGRQRDTRRWVAASAAVDWQRRVLSDRGRTEYAGVPVCVTFVLVRGARRVVARVVRYILGNLLVCVVVRRRRVRGVRHQWRRCVRTRHVWMWRVRQAVQRRRRRRVRRRWRMAGRGCALWQDDRCGRRRLLGLELILERAQDGVQRAVVHFGALPFLGHEGIELPQLRVACRTIVRAESVECGWRRATIAARLSLGGHACEQTGEVRFLTRERVREFPHIQPVVPQLRAAARALGHPRPCARVAMMAVAMTRATRPILAELRAIGCLGDGALHTIR